MTDLTDLHAAFRKARVEHDAARAAYSDASTAYTSACSLLVEADRAAHTTRDEAELNDSPLYAERYVLALRAKDTATRIVAERLAARGAAETRFNRSRETFAAAKKAFEDFAKAEAAR